jgi:hypothetical protein
MGPGVWLMRHALKIYGRGLRGEYLNIERYHEARTSGRPLVIGFWHEDLPSMIACKFQVLPDEMLTVMISQSRDGELITKAVEPHGIKVVRGSSSSGGAKGLRALIAWMEICPSQPPVVVFPLDGPRGPRRKAKPGAVMVARRTNALLLPVAVRTPRRWMLGSWDRMRIARPWSGVSYLSGEVFDARAMTGSDADVAEEISRRLNALHEELGND